MSIGAAVGGHRHFGPSRGVARRSHRNVIGAWSDVVEAEQRRPASGYDLAPQLLEHDRRAGNGRRR